MLDHPFGDATGALRSALEAAFLERQAIEERFSTDILTGDMRFETSYSIPGEGHPARVQADITAAWPTWSQAAYRTWHLRGELPSVPVIELDVVFRGQDLPAPANIAEVLLATNGEGPELGRTRITRQGGPTTETTFDANGELLDHSIETSFSGRIELHEQVLADGNELDQLLSVIGSWISSTLVALSDRL